MKAIKYNSQIVSLENVKSVNAITYICPNSIDITYMGGYMGSNGHFHYHSTSINNVKDPNALLEKIYEILKKKD
jgi:hypothetical protein